MTRPTPLLDHADVLDDILLILRKLKKIADLSKKPLLFTNPCLSSGANKLEIVINDVE